MRASLLALLLLAATATLAQVGGGFPDGANKQRFFSCFVLSPCGGEVSPTVLAPLVLHASEHVAGGPSGHMFCVVHEPVTAAPSHLLLCPS